MSLLEQSKAERRTRILEAARRLMANSGYAALNMRDLAVEARVSVPTVYNLVGGKQAVLVELLEETFANVAAQVPTQSGMVDQVFAIAEGGYRVLLDAPEYSRALFEACLTSDEAAQLRQDLDGRFVALMASVLAEGQRRRSIVAWADVLAVSSAMYAGYVTSMLRWAKHELTDSELPRVATANTAFVLLGVTRGKAREQIEARVRELQGAVSAAFKNAFERSSLEARSVASKKVETAS
jgi:AcrR family transcriptional regulator